MLLKRFGIATAILAGLIFANSVQVSAQQQSSAISVYYPSMHFVFDGKELSPPEGQNGFIYEGSTYVPLRFISYALNKGVEWDPDTYTVSVGAPTAEQKLEIAEYRLDRTVKKDATQETPPAAVVVPEPTQIHVYFEKVQYIFGGEQKQPSDDLPDMIYENSLYVPMRFFSESIGMKIDWDPITYTVSAESSNPAYENKIAEVEDEIYILRDEALQYFSGLYVKYVSADETQKKALRVEGAAKLEEFDIHFDNILLELKGYLVANSLSLEILDSYRQDYETQKSLAKALTGM